MLSDYTISMSVIKLASIWYHVETARPPGVQWVWCHQNRGGRLLNVISIKNSFPTDSRQAVQLCCNVHAGNYLGRCLHAAIQLKISILRAGISRHWIPSGGAAWG